MLPHALTSHQTGFPQMPARRSRPHTLRHPTLPRVGHATASVLQLSISFAALHLLQRLKARSPAAKSSSGHACLEDYVTTLILTIKHNPSHMPRSSFTYFTLPHALTSHPNGMPADGSAPLALTCLVPPMLSHERPTLKHNPVCLTCSFSRLALFHMPTDASAPVVLTSMSCQASTRLTPCHAATPRFHMFTAAHAPYAMLPRAHRGSRALRHATPCFRALTAAHMPRHASTRSPQLTHLALRHAITHAPNAQAQATQPPNFHLLSVMKRWTRPRGVKRKRHAVRAEEGQAVVVCLVSS